MIGRLKARLERGETAAKFRKHATDFTRKRTLTFARVVVLILRGHKLPIQTGLSKLFQSLGKVFQTPTASAYSQARRKIEPEVFRELTHQMCADLYELNEEDGETRLWRGHRLLGADGTTLNLPDTPELRLAFSEQGNQHARYPQAMAVVLYDLLNDIGLDGEIGRLQHEKRLLFGDMWKQTRPGDVLVLDRHFADYAVIAVASSSGRHVVIRCGHKRSVQIDGFWGSSATETTINLQVSQHAETRAFVAKHGLPTSVRVRLMKFKLPSGEIEVLLTTLCDRKAYPKSIFFEVYGLRWNQETYYKRVKSIFEVERFSGQTEQTIRQDFYGLILLATLETIVTREAQDELANNEQATPLKTEAKVNRADSYTILLDRLVELLLNKRASAATILDEMRHLFLLHPMRHPPNRHVPRRPPTASEQLAFHLYQKRIIS